MCAQLVALSGYASDSLSPEYLAAIKDLYSPTLVCLQATDIDQEVRGGGC